MGQTTHRANHLFKMALMLHILRQRNRVDDILRCLFRDRNKPLDYLSDESIVKNYRLDRESIYIMCQDLEHDLLGFTNRSHSISVSLMIALRYYASGSYMSVIWDAHGVSKLFRTVLIRCQGVFRTTCQIMCSFLCQQKSSK